MLSTQTPHLQALLRNAHSRKQEERETGWGVPELLLLGFSLRPLTRAGQGAAGTGPDSNGEVPWDSLLASMQDTRNGFPPGGETWGYDSVGAPGASGSSS